MRARPVSTTERMPGTVSDVSATFVASTIRRPPCGTEDPVLLRVRQPRVQGQDLDALQRLPVPGLLLEPVGGFPDLALAGQEHEHVRAVLAQQCLARVHDRRGHVALLVVVLVAARTGLLVVERGVAHLDGVGAAFGEHDRCTIEVLREALRVDRRRRHDELQVRALRQHALQVAEQEVDVQRALVRLVDDDRVVALEQRVLTRLGEQDPVGHELDVGALGDLVGEADLEADRFADLRAQLARDARRHGARRDPARLGVADEPRRAAPGLEADLRQLRRLARARLAAHDDDLVLLERLENRLATLDDGQVVGVGRDRGVRGARVAPGGRALYRLQGRGALGRVVPGPVQAAGQARAVGAQRALERAVGSDLGRWLIRFGMHRDSGAPGALFDHLTGRNGADSAPIARRTGQGASGGRVCNRPAKAPSPAYFGA